MAVLATVRVLVLGCLMVVDVHVEGLVDPLDCGTAARVRSGFKLAENMPRSASQVLVAAGHDVDTVVDEGLAGASDPQVVAAATVTGQLLITLDRGLGDIREYPPGGHAGILVLRPPDQSAVRLHLPEV